MPDIGQATLPAGFAGRDRDKVAWAGKAGTRLAAGNLKLQISNPKQTTSTKPQSPPVSVGGASSPDCLTESGHGCPSYRRRRRGFQAPRSEPSGQGCPSYKSRRAEPWSAAARAAAVQGSFASGLSDGRRGFQTPMPEPSGQGCPSYKHRITKPAVGGKHQAPNLKSQTNHKHQCHKP